jgi:ketosteroid isomerase-like protein
MSAAPDVGAFADRFMAALEASDREAVRAFYAPDAKLWHNFDNVDQSVDENLKMFEWMARKLPQRRYRILRREPLADGWLQQHVLEGQLPDGRSLQLHACCVITMKNGLITRLEEYVDPAQASVLSTQKR